MAKIYSSKPHKNENAAIQFGAAIAGAVREVRQSISALVKSRKADEYAPGAIHALRKLCDGETSRGHIHRKEVEEWRACFLAWFKRVKRWIPDQYADEFLHNAQDDFRVILDCSDKMPEDLWRQDVDKRHIQVTFKNEAALKAARQAADEKHPVKLGNALHKYLESCTQELVQGDDHETPTGSRAEKELRTDAIAPRFALCDDGLISICLDDFSCFDSADELAQDIVTTAYDVEEAVRHYLDLNFPDTTPQLYFDCESSTFCVRTSQMDSLAVLTQSLIQLATDRELYRQHRSDR